MLKLLKLKFVPSSLSALPMVQYVIGLSMYSANLLRVVDLHCFAFNADTCCVIPSHVCSALRILDRPKRRLLRAGKPRTNAFTSR